MYNQSKIITCEIIIHVWREGEREREREREREGEREREREGEKEAILDVYS